MFLSDFFFLSSDGRKNKRMIKRWFLCEIKCMSHKNQKKKMLLFYWKIWINFFYNFAHTTAIIYWAWISHSPPSFNEIINIYFAQELKTNNNLREHFIISIFFYIFTSCTLDWNFSYRDYDFLEFPSWK